MKKWTAQLIAHCDGSPGSAIAAHRPSSLDRSRMAIQDRLGKLGVRVCAKAKGWRKKFSVISSLCKTVWRRECSGDEEEVDNMAAFAPVLARVRLDALPEYASSIRRSGLLQDPQNSSQYIDEACKTSQITIESPPLYGAYNILFPVRFADGARWILKIPAAGGSEARWDSSAARALESEALTMRMLTKNTSMPIPLVHAFDPSMQNPLGCPYILMDYLNGRPLHERWHNDEAFRNKDELKAFRARTLETLTTSMAQLTLFTYNQSGSLSFDAQGNFYELGPARVYDAATMHNNLFDGEANDNLPFCDIGPFHDLRDYLRYMVDRHRPAAEGFGIGLYRMLVLFIEWLPEDYVKAPFVLAHPDFDLQNVLVEEDGTVCGLIDWDGVAAEPRYLGCESYPKWLTHDWDPFFYNFDVENRKLYQECGQPEHPPEELFHYRKLYAHFMKNALSTHQDGTARSTGKVGTYHQPAFGNRPGTTGKSLLIGSLGAAAINPLSTDGAIINIFDKIAEMTTHKHYNQGSKCTSHQRIVECSEESMHPMPEITRASPAIDGDIEYEDSDLREMAWILRYNDMDDGIDLDNSESPIIVGKEDCQQQKKALDPYSQRFSGYTALKKRKPLWTQRHWSKIGSLMHKASAHLHNSRAKDILSLTQLCPLQGPATMLNSTDRSEPSRSSRSSSIERALSMVTTDKNSQVTRLTEVSTPDRHVTTACTNNDDVRKDTATVSAPRTTASSKQTYITPGAKPEQEAQGQADGPCNTSATQPTVHTPLHSPISAEHSPDNKIRGGKGASSKPCKFIKAPCRLARRILAKLPHCGRKANVTKTIDSSRNSTSDVEDPQAHPIGFGTHNERITAMKKAATQKGPSGLAASEAQGCAQSESHLQPKPIMEEPTSVANTKARSKASAIRQRKEDPIREEEEDDIGFMAASVCYALADGTLSEARMRRLKDGFYLLLDSL